MLREPSVSSGRRARWLALRAIRLAVAVLVGAFALAGPVAGIVLPPSQPGVSVYDLAHAWQPSTVAQAQATADAIRARTQAEIAIVSIPTGLSSVSTDIAKTDALLIMNTWGVGRAGVNDGLVVLFDLDDTLQHGQVYLYTGQGFRDLYLSDEEAQSIVDDAMLPKAKDGDLDGALLAGMAKLDHVVQPGGNPDRAATALLHALTAAAIIATALIVLGWFVRTWWQRGRDARVPLIDDSVLLPAPPPELTPALATALRKDQVDHESFTTALVDLGHRGLLTFEEHGLLSKHVDFVVPDAPLHDAASEDARRRPLGPAESALLEGVGDATVAGVLSWSQLRTGTGKKLFDAFEKALGQAALAAGWFRDDPTAITSRWVAVGVGLSIAGAALAFLFVLDRGDNSDLVLPGRGYLGWPLLLAIGVGVAVAIFSRILAARTPAGAQTLAMALAYRNTLRYELAQADTIHDAVEKTSSRLPWITTPDELTVWAVALGLKDEVDRVIKETMRVARDSSSGASWAPVWFSGSGGLGAVGNVTSMLGSIPAPAASSSGSGYGGGGGGGGGGAGGGF
jgi:uncharacterized membrane protein YgcG